jgi:membrane protein
MPWKPENLSNKELGRRVWTKISEHDVFGRSAQLSYYFFFALFPALIVLTSLVGLLATGQAQQHIMQWLGRALPPDAASLVNRTLTQVIQSSGGGKLSFGLLVSLWSAASGMLAIIGALNIAYEVKESRGFIKLRWTGLWLTVVVAALFVSAIVIVLYGNTIVGIVAGALHLGPVLAWAWKIVQWPVALGFVLLAFALTYYAGPNRENPSWKWVSPGAVAGLVLWLVVSFVLRVYLHFFNSYEKTYGALGAVMILLLWFYCTGLSILAGAEINSEIEHAAAKAGKPDAKAKGERREQSQEPLVMTPHPRRAA